MAKDKILKAGRKAPGPSAAPDKVNHRLRYRLRRKHYAEMPALPVGKESAAHSSIAHVLAERGQQIAKLTTDIATWRDVALRAKAELENARKRFQREKVETIQFATEHLIKELIPVVDNLERALASALGVQDPKALHDGIIMVIDQFIAVLRANGLEIIAPEGQRFDPHFHEAVSAEEREDVEDNQVLGTFQKGYILRGRVVRPAMVRVARAVRRPVPADEPHPAEATEALGSPGMAGEETIADFDDTSQVSEDQVPGEPSGESDPSA